MAKVAPPPPQDVQDGFDKNISLLTNSQFPGLREDPYRTLRQVVIWLDTYYIPTLFALGMLGNLLSLVVFVATYLRRLSLSVYLAALALTDSAFLLALLVRWLEFAGWPIFHTAGWCQLVTYLSYVTSFLSAWLVVSFTVERYIAIVHPLHRPRMCTTRRAKVVVTGLSVFGLLAYSCSLWTSGIVVTQRHQICSPLWGYKQIYIVMAYADFVVTLLVPFIAIFAFNVRIAVKIASFYNKKETARALAMLGRASSVRLGNRAQVKVTKLLLIISTVFLVVNLPSYVMRVRTFVQTFSNSAGRKRRPINPLDPILHQIFHNIFYLNFSINFLIYSVCSKQFRRALKRLVWQIKYKVSKLSTRLTSRGATYWGDGNGPGVRTLKDMALKHRLNDPGEGVL